MTMGVRGNQTNLQSSLTESKKYPYIVAGSVGVYWLSVSLIPVYNKFFFKKELYPYPVATAGIQLAVVSLVLIVVNLAQHFYNVSKSSPTEEEKGPFQYVQVNDRERSWIFGPHFLWKLKWTFPIGFLFGLKYGVTNLGLHVIPTQTHLLLQSTDMVWTLLGAWWMTGERVTFVGFACIVGCVLGSVALSIRVGETIAAPFFAIAVNLISPILLGLCLTTLRVACTELMRKDNRVGGTVSSVELSAFKLVISSTVALCLACLMENEKHITVGEDNGTESIISPSWMDAFVSLPRSTQLGVIGGAGLIVVFQVNCTFLTKITSCLAVGLVGQAKIIPQWIVAALFAPGSHIDLSLLNGLGSALTMASAGVFALSNWLAYRYPGKFRSASFTVGADEILKGESKALILNSADSTAVYEYDSISRHDSDGSFASSNQSAEIDEETDNRIINLGAHTESQTSTEHNNNTPCACCGGVLTV